ncbi:DUF485 domain-containing protein [Actinomycetota bacterium]
MSHQARDYTDSADPYLALQQTQEFGDLRRKFRGFVFPMTAFFLAWYFLYVLLSIFAPGFMGTKVFGNINIGLLMGLGQFVTTFAITMIYSRWASREFDPRADALGAKLDGVKEH